MKKQMKDRNAWKELGMRLLFPKTIWIFLLVNASALALIYIFMHGMEEHPIAYIIYAASAYALTIACARIPAIVRKIDNKLQNNQYTYRYMTDEEFRQNFSMYRGLCVNIPFAIFKVLMGILYQSSWLFAMAGYHILLSFMRFILVYRERKERNEEDSIEKRTRYIRTYRLCGGMLLLLNLAITVIVGFVVVRNQEITYPGYMIFVIAAFSFYCFAMAIKNLIKYHKLDNPVYSAVKRIELAKALVSIFTTQVAMLTQFGDGNAAMNQRMNAITGLGVCILITVTAVIMLRKKNKRAYLEDSNS